MTTGFFTADREPALSLEIRGPDGAQSFDAVIDTGYNGALAFLLTGSTLWACPSPAKRASVWPMVG